MTAIDAQLARGPTFSIEVFPPKTERGRDTLRAALDRLEQLDLSFVSVTYGAGGSTRDRTQEVVDEIGARGLTVMPHLTCIGHSRQELVGLLQAYRDAGQRNVLALHGDPPRDNPDLASGDLQRAIDLVHLAREVGGFSVGVAAHPEGHPKAPDRASDRRHQAEKLRVADFGITQFFFRAEDYLTLVDDLAALGVDTPIIPGIIPVTDHRQTARFAELSGASIPPELMERFDAAADAEEVKRIGIDVATALGQRLLDAGAPGLHVYALNRAEATEQVRAALPLDAPRDPQAG